MNESQNIRTGSYKQIQIFLKAGIYFLKKNLRKDKALQCGGHISN